MIHNKELAFYITVGIAPHHRKILGNFNNHQHGKSHKWLPVPSGRWTFGAA